MHLFHWWPVPSVPSARLQISRLATQNEACHAEGRAAMTELINPPIIKMPYTTLIEPKGVALGCDT